eukprot:COSAG02_NODE_40177_length_408_cov_1.000000_1_plen_58_part_10
MMLQLSKGAESRITRPLRGAERARDDGAPRARHAQVAQMDATAGPDQVRHRGAMETRP